MQLHELLTIPKRGFKSDGKVITEALADAFAASDAGGDGGTVQRKGWGLPEEKGLLVGECVGVPRLDRGDFKVTAPYATVHRIKTAAGAEAQVVDFTLRNICVEYYPREKNAGRGEGEPPFKLNKTVLMKLGFDSVALAVAFVEGILRG